LLFIDDFSRVRLVSMNEEEGADYINANYIPVSRSEKPTHPELKTTQSRQWKAIGAKGT
jgi:receptor-type tyrosine-protein phosphatase O